MSKSEFNFDGSAHDTVMTVNDLHCVFNMPKALKSQMNEGKEVIQGLPPYSPRKAFKVDEYDCPVSWMHGSSLASSYFVPVEGERGMWLDFNRCFSHKYHVAVLISVQGVNPLDGQSMVEENLHLSQYRNKCKIHDEDFKADRFCEKCGYKWVPQNYLATTGTPPGRLWLDGFLAADGVVRQYYFTEEEAKGVAHQIIGAEKKVYSIGIAFYLSKEPKPVVQQHVMRGYGLESFSLCSAPIGGQCALSRKLMKVGASNVKMSVSLNASDSLASYDPKYDYEDAGGSSMKILDIAAGAKINQKVYADPNDLSFWQAEPAGMLYINYTPTEQAIAILKKGKKDLTKGGEGFLAGLKAGK